MLEIFLDKNEKLLWRGKPDFLLYVIGYPFILFFALLWFVLTSIVFRGVGNISNINDFAANEHLPFDNMFIIMQTIFYSIPVLLAVILPLYRVFNYHTVEYAFTDMRVYIIGGLFGRDITIIEHRHLENLAVTVNFIENMRGLGSIRLTPDITKGTGKDTTTVHGYRFFYIKKPYEVYKLLKKVSTDVTTDQQYPNAYRPAENPGYNTSYKNDKL